MGMITRCPSCLTGFRVTPEQLQAHRGTVRCGRCSTVFNAFDSLTTLPDAPQTPAEPETILAADEFEEPAPPDAVTVVATLPESAVAPSPESPAEAQLVESATQGESAQEPARESTAGSEPPTVMPPAAAAPAQVAAEEPERIVESEPRFGRRTVPVYDFTPAHSARRRGSPRWFAGALLLGLLLAVQLGYVFRAEIAAAYPQIRPALESACGLIRCTVPLPRQADQWSIESSDLQADPGHPSLVTLAAVLRNRSALAQDFPALELTLTDAANEPLARRVLTAEDYLPKGMNPRPGLGPNNEVVVRIALETGNLNPVGYRLFLYYP
jgi:predicted Zn finger-like uncharacterized protein